MVCRQVSNYTMGRISRSNVMLRTRDGRFTATAEQAILLRSQGKTWRAVAEATGRTERTIVRLGQDAEFKQAVESLRDEYIGEALNLLKAHAVDAAATVVDVMQTGVAKRDEPRLAAAQDILDRLGVAITTSDPAPPVIAADISIGVIIDAERAFIAALRAQPLALVGTQHAGESSDAWHDSVRALPVPGGVPRGSEPFTVATEGAADRDESNRGA